MLEFKNVSLGYGKKIVLDGLTFKKISRAVYHETEETSTNICNYRIVIHTQK